MSYLMSTELCMVEMLTLINIKPKKTAYMPSPCRAPSALSSTAVYPVGGIGQADAHRRPTRTRPVPSP